MEVVGLWDAGPPWRADELRGRIKDTLEPWRPDVAAMRAANFTALDFRIMRRTAGELKDAGFALSELKDPDDRAR